MPGHGIVRDCSKNFSGGGGGGRIWRVTGPKILMNTYRGGGEKGGHSLSDNR